MVTKGFLSCPFEDLVEFVRVVEVQTVTRDEPLIQVDVHLSPSRAMSPLRATLRP